MFPPIQFLFAMNEWRTSWASIVAGNFVGNGSQQALLYDSPAGEIDIMGFNDNRQLNPPYPGDMSFDTANSGLSTTFDYQLIVVGNFIGNGLDQALLYDRNGQGGVEPQVDIVGFDANGNMNLHGKNSGMGGLGSSTIDQFLVGDFLGIGLDVVLAYDPSSAGQVMYTFDGLGNINSPIPTQQIYYNWGTWDRSVVGKFIGNGHDQILLYNQNANQANIVGFDADGNINLNTKNSGDAWPAGPWLSPFVVGDFLGIGQDQVLLYNLSTGQAYIVAFDTNGNTSLATENNLSADWNIAVAGDFLGMGRSQIVQYNIGPDLAQIAGFDNNGDTNLEALGSVDLSKYYFDFFIGGDFMGNGQQQILAYDSAVGQGDVISFQFEDDAGTIGEVRNHYESGDLPVLGRPG
jgi:hypothetical protein